MKVSEGYNGTTDEETELHMDEIGGLEEKPIEKKGTFFEQVASEVKEVNTLFSSGKQGFGDAFSYGYKKGTTIIEGATSLIGTGSHRSD